MKTKRFSVTPFEGLMDALEKKKKSPPPSRGRAPGAPGEPGPGKSEDELFREAMDGVKEIAEFRGIPAGKPRAHALPGPKRDDSLHALRDIVEGRTGITLPDTDEYVEWVRPGLRRDTARRLHQGEFSVREFIDLHGMTVEEAEAALSSFITDAMRSRSSCIKVIHGRGLRSPGGPVLKEAVLRLLCGPLRKHINAFATARQKDGGLGATYVLLSPVPRAGKPLRRKG